jgi:hypothetical protein
LICEKGVIRMHSGGMYWQYRNVISDPIFIKYRSLDTSRYIDGRCLEAMTRAVNDIYFYLQTGNTDHNRGENLLAAEELCMQIHKDALAKRVVKI